MNMYLTLPLVVQGKILQLHYNFFCYDNVLLLLGSRLEHSQIEFGNSGLADRKWLRPDPPCSGVTSCVTRLVTLILCMLGVHIATPEIIKKLV